MRFSLAIPSAALVLTVGLVMFGGGGDRGAMPTTGQRVAPVDRNAGKTLDPRATSEPASLAGGMDSMAVEALFAADRGAEVVLPAHPAVPGRVNLVDRRDTGEAVLGIRLGGDYEGANVFLARRPDGRISGHFFWSRSATALRIESSPVTGKVEARVIGVDDLLCVRTDGGRLEPGLPPEPLGSEGGGEGSSEAAESDSAMESRPGSRRVIFLNFAGETVTGTPWNSVYNNGNPIVAAPFANPAHIPGIWASIAEDYAVYDVNVTTDRSAYLAAAPEDRVMIVFTPTKSWYGNAGGVAFVDSFGSENPYAWVFNLTLNGCAESGSHEIGHTLGLRHDGTTSRAYYLGHTHPSGVSWGPIMGTSYGRSIVQFSKGEYPNANRTEDDFALMSRHLDLLADDHGDLPTIATEVIPTAPGRIAESGIVGSQNDVDLFRLETDGDGTIALAAVPHSTYRNLDLGLELLDENLAVLETAEPEGPYDASVSLSGMPRGVYFIRVRGTGLGTLANGYSTYGSVGTYSLSGTFPPGALPEAPTITSASDGTSTDSVTIAWNATALTELYRVYRGLDSDGNDAAQIGSTADLNYVDATAVPGTVYFYFVSATNVVGESPRSAGVEGWRQRLPPAAPVSPQASDDWPHSIRVSWLAAERAQAYRISRNPVNSFAGAMVVATVSGLSWHDMGTSAETAHYYFVEALNSGGVSDPVATANPGWKPQLVPGTPVGLNASDGTSPARTDLDWTAAPDATGYRVWRNTVESVVGAIEIAQVGAVTSYVDRSGNADTGYWYFVTAILPAGDSAPSNLDAGYRYASPPAAPGSISATRGTEPGGILVSWSASEDTQSYRIYRAGESTPGNLELATETTDLQWLDEGAAPGRTYRYLVRAVNESGASADSPTASGFGPERDSKDDPFEENDLLTEATLLPAAPIAATAIDGDPDWYALSLDPEDPRIDLTVPSPAGFGTLKVALFDENGLLVTSAQGAPLCPVVSWVGEPGSSYRVLVESDEGAAVPYRFYWWSRQEDEHGLSPDLTIGTAFPPRLGEGIIQPVAQNQTLVIPGRFRRTVRAYVDLANQAAVSGGFLTRGTPGPRSVDVHSYLRVGSVWSNVTASMRRGGIGGRLTPFAKQHFSITARPLGAQRFRGGSYLPIWSGVTADPASRDAVRVKLPGKAGRR